MDTKKHENGDGVRVSFMKCRAILGVVFLLALLSSTVTRADDRPNIVLILADDLGYSDLGCYGGEIETPNLNRLAEEGVRFTQFHNAARCCPTRACLLTGLHPHQADVGHMTYDAGEPGYHGDLSKNAVTLAEVLGSAGYRTYMCGKWHVTRNTQPGSDPSNRPTARGFDKFFGTLPGYGSQWDPMGLMRDKRFITWRDVKPEGGFFYTDAISETASAYIEEAAAGKKPFFLYVAYTAPHYPLHARQKTIEKYDGVYDIGWDELRRRRYERLVELGLLDRKHALPPRDEASIPWEDDPHQKWQADRMQAYAAMVDEMDQGIGQILATLAKTGAAENTVVVFLSDNGASSEGHLNNTVERLGIPWTGKLTPKTTPDGKPVRPGDIPGLALGPADTFGSYGIRWASVSNVPFRRHKSWVHEGGIATPCIVRWPGRIHEGGHVCREIAHVVDIMPSFVELAGAEYPAEYRGRPITPMQGESLVKLLDGEHLDRDVLCWEHEGNRAVRTQKWKLVSEFPGTWSRFYSYPKQGRWELYDMENDRTELHDLSEQRPDVVQRLEKVYEDWAERTGVIPWEKLEGKRI